LNEQDPEAVKASRRRSAPAFPPAAVEVAGIDHEIFGNNKVLAVFRQDHFFATRVNDEVSAGCRQSRQSGSDSIKGVFR
jgi:hypothetical protein